jgi:hypothetical protein
VIRCTPLFFSALAGCATSLGTVALVTPNAEDVGLKLLRPAIIERSCRSSVLGVPLRSGTPDIREALGAMLAIDREANVVANVEIGSERLVTGVYNRRCVTVRGDLARTVATIRLPSPPGHEAHRGH